MPGDHDFSRRGLARGSLGQAQDQPGHREHGSEHTADDGEILASEPKLTGYEVAAQLIPQFPDQILIGRMVNEKGQESHRMQFGAKVSKTVKEKKNYINSFKWMLTSLLFQMK